MGIKKENIKSAIEKKTFTEISSDQLPDAQTSFNVPIKNVNINASGGEYGIKIENSAVHFRIENCNISNTGNLTRSDACIKLVNVSKGYLYNNYLTNRGVGIYSIMLKDSTNNSLIQNTASSNDNVGIFLWGSDNNTVSGNMVLNNGQDGIY